MFSSVRANKGQPSKCGCSWVAQGAPTVRNLSTVQDTWAIVRVNRSPRVVNRNVKLPTVCKGYVIHAPMLLDGARDRIAGAATSADSEQRQGKIDSAVV